MFHNFRASLILLIIFIVLTGIAYPLVTFGIGQVVFPRQANGSLVEDANGKVIGSELIGQNFISELYFHPRPSSAGNGYDASNSSGSNLGPTSEDLAKAVTDRVMALKKNGDIIPVPVDMVTASGSGLDPDISPANARFQAPRVAEARHLNLVQVQELVTKYTVLPPLGVVGEAHVNVFDINRALDGLLPAKSEE